MDLEDRRAAVAAALREQDIDLLLGFHDSAHFIEKPNPVMMLAGFKSMGDTVLWLTKEGECRLIVSPEWDAERAAEQVPGALGSRDVIADLERHLQRLPAARIGVAGLAAMPAGFEAAVRALFKSEPQALDALVLKHARRKTSDEIARAKKATQIAERGYERLLEIVRPGMREDELASEIRWTMKALGAEDNFFMLTSGPHSKAVQTSSGRRLEKGDLVLGELTPSYEGQMAQICRTLTIGPANEVVKEKYALLIEAMKQGLAKAKAGNRMAEVCNAINAVLEAKGYGQYCHPPHIKRRGHGLGFGGNLPGDVAPDNDILLEPDMFFVVHPNQYLPETGYMMCGEPTLITAEGPRTLSARMAWLAEVAA